MLYKTKETLATVDQFLVKSDKKEKEKGRKFNPRAGKERGESLLNKHVIFFSTWINFKFSAQSL